MLTFVEHDVDGIDLSLVRFSPKTEGISMTVAQPMTRLFVATVSK